MILSVRLVGHKKRQLRTGLVRSVYNVLFLTLKTKHLYEPYDYWFKPFHKDTKDYFGRNNFKLI